MKKNSKSKLLSLILVIVLTAAAALTGCSGAPAGTTEAPMPPAESTGTTPPATISDEPASTDQVTVLGEGSKAFDFSVVDKEGTTHLYRIRTDAEMIGQALLEQELIAGEDGPYGMYIKSVLGQVLDYETDGMYWAFYVNGDYAMTGVDTTPIEEGCSYTIKAEAG